MTPRAILNVKNPGKEVVEFELHDAYADKRAEYSLQPGATSNHSYALEKSSGWYDLTITSKGDAAFRQHFAGHLETGMESTTDPAMGKAQLLPA